MAFTYPWDETLPLGSDPANTLDTIIQNLKKSIRERMNDKIFDDFTLDPLTLKGLTAAKIVISGLEFAGNDGGGHTYGAGDCYINAAVSQNVRAPLRLPVGLVIASWRVLVRTLTASSGMTVALKKHAFAAGASPSTVRSTAIAYNAADQLITDSFAETTDGSLYYVEMAPAGAVASRMYGVELTVGVPNITSLLG